MTETAFLGGRVRKWSLPVVQGAGGDYSLKRLLLPQGELARIYDADEGMRFIAYIELRAGGLRGNHFHKVKQEWVYVIQGEMELLLQEPETNGRETVRMQTGDLALIPTGIAHAIRTIQPGHAVEFSSSRFDPEDSFRFQVG
jgi:oxalate decarboxylase/phosphoglucose isomerase-like protein (cupin superfamily)